MVFKTSDMYLNNKLSISRTKEGWSSWQSQIKKLFLPDLHDSKEFAQLMAPRRGA
jgi:hypothetical protein